MLFLLIATSIFAGTCALTAWRVLTIYGALACAALGAAFLLPCLNSMHWPMSGADAGALAIAIAGLAAALSLHRWRTLARHKASA